MSENPAEGTVNPPAPTQVQHPWRATLRTLFAALVAFASMWSLVVEALGLDTTWQWVSISLAVTAGITRVMQLPAVNLFIEKYAPWLAAKPADDYLGGHRAI